MIVALWLLLGAGGDDPLARGERAWKAGDAAGALTAWAEALQAARASGDRAAELDTLLRLAAVNRQIGRVKTAEEILDRAAPLAADEGAKARVALDRGLLALASGDFPDAEKRFQAAFEGLQRAGDAQGAANAATDLGIARLGRGRDAEARRALEGALALFEALKDPSGQASARVQLARLERRQGRPREALSQVDEAVGAALLGGDGATLVEAQLLRGTVQRELGRTDAARASLQAALDAARTRKDVAAQGRLFNALAGLYQESGDPKAAGHYQAAEQAFSQIGDRRAALAVAVNAAGQDGFQRAELTALAARARDDGDLRIRAAIALNLAAVGDRSALSELGPAIERSGAPDLLWRTRYHAGIAALEAGKRKEGVQSLVAAVDELERRRRGLDGQDARAFATRHTDVYDALIDALLASGETARAFVYAQRLQQQDLPASDDPALAALAAEEDALVEAASNARDPEQEAALAARLADLRVRFASAVDTLRSTQPAFARAVRLDPEDLEAVQAELPPGVTVLQPLLLPDRVALLVFARDRLEAREVAVDGAAVEKQILKLSRSLQAAHTRDPAWTIAQADALGAWFVAPVADLLDGTRTLVVSATGPLRELPFALLRHDGRWLIEDRAVVGITHVGSLTGRSEPLKIQGDAALLVGDPDGSLPGARTEVERLRSRMPAARALIGAEATREAIAASAAGKRVIHLATHGVIDRDHPDRSYLRVAGEGDAGRLSYREIPGLAPSLSSCRLVVLSACQSGLAVDAKAPVDAEGGIVISINGLAAQFRRAGVETLVASLWRVDDGATLGLMTAFYAELAAGSDVGESLRRAQLRLLAEPATAHPWYWSGFAVVGDWR